MEKESRHFCKSLGVLERALGRNRSYRWGVAGFREESLVFMLAETLHQMGWQVTYEPPYAKSFGRSFGKQRGDLLAVPPDRRAPLWLEAKWWWRHGDSLGTILQGLRKKMGRVREPHRRIAAVFTVDVASASWSVKKAKAVMARNRRGRGKWRLVGCTCLPGRYVGSTTRDPASKPRRGVFVAAFFELQE